MDSPTDAAAVVVIKEKIGGYWWHSGQADGRKWKAEMVKAKCPTLYISEHAPCMFLDQDVSPLHVWFPHATVTASD
jgi:hypothetical protein